MRTCTGKKLSFRKGTARCATLVNSCNISRDMGVRKSGFQGHTGAMVPFNRPHTISY